MTHLKVPEMRKLIALYKKAECPRASRMKKAELMAFIDEHKLVEHHEKEMKMFKEATAHAPEAEAPKKKRAGKKAGAVEDGAEKPKRKASAFAMFVKANKKPGMSMAEVAKMYHAQKGGAPKAEMKAEEPKMPAPKKERKKRTSNPVIKALEKHAPEASEIAKALDKREEGVTRKDLEEAIERAIERNETKKTNMRKPRATGGKKPRVAPDATPRDAIVSTTPVLNAIAEEKIESLKPVKGQSKTQPAVPALMARVQQLRSVEEKPAQKAVEAVKRVEKLDKMPETYEGKKVTKYSYFIHGGEKFPEGKIFSIDNKIYRANKNDARGNPVDSFDYELIAEVTLSPEEQLRREYNKEKFQIEKDERRLMGEYEGNPPPAELAELEARKAENLKKKMLVEKNEKKKD